MLLKTVIASLLVSQCLGKSQTALSAGQTAVSSPIDDLIIKLLEKIRDSLPEPLPLGDLPIDIDQTGFIMHANITDAVLHDLSTFVIDNVHVNVITLKADLALSLPTLSLDCNYTFDSSSVIANLFPFYGSGPCSVALGNLSVSVDAGLKHNRSDGHKHTQIDTMDFNLHFDTLDVQIHNLFDNDELATVIDGFADDFGPLLVDILVNETRHDLLPVIIDELNTLLWNMSIPLADKAAVQSSEPTKLLPKLTSTFNANSLDHDSLIRYQQDHVQISNLDWVVPPDFDTKKRQGYHVRSPTN